MLEAENIVKKFGGLWAIDRLNFMIEEGEIVGLIGPNGSGKTTLFNVITGLYPADQGRVVYKGKDITRLKTHMIAKLGITRTFQIVRPLLSLTVEENVAVAACYGRDAIDSVVKAKKRAWELLEFVGLECKRHLRAEDLVTAERKRLEIARSLAVRPDLLLLDETFSGLNEIEVQDAIEMIFRIRDELGITIFLIEHVMKAIMGTCDKIIAMDHGVKLVEGKPEEVASDSSVIEAYLGRKHAAGKKY